MKKAPQILTIPFKISFILVLGLGAILNAARAAIIDDFSQGALLFEPTNYLPGLTTLQTGLPTHSTIGGSRRVTAQTQDHARLEIDPLAGQFSFQAVSSWGYFGIEYGADAPLGVDLRADGSEAFLLRFSEVAMTGLWRGSYNFRVNGKNYELLRDLAAINGAGTIRIPFSYFSTAATFVASQISLSAGRVESPYRLVLDSIVTVGPNTPPRLDITMLDSNSIRLGWSTNDAGFTLETASEITFPKWDALTNAVSVVGTQFSVTVPTPEHNRYYRLRKE